MAQSHRHLQIIEILVRQDDYITINDIASKLSVSNRTIRNDLNELEAIFKENKINLIKKTGVGIKISHEHQDVLNLFSFAKENISQTRQFNAQERQSYIILRILSQTETRILDLIDELYVSRATLQKDFQKIEETCSQYRLNFLRRREKGLFIKGEERHIRTLMFDLMLQDPSIHILNKFILNQDTKREGALVFYGLDYTDDEIAYFIKVVNQKIPNLISQMNPNSLSLLYVMIFIIIKRINIHQSVKLSEAFKEELQEYQTMHTLALKIMSVCRTIFNTEDYCDDEIYFLQAFVLAYQPNTDLDEKTIEKLKALTDTLIQYYTEEMNMKFNEDQQLYHNLYEHLHSMYMRVKHGIQMNNPLQLEVNLYYKNTFDIVKSSFKTLENPIWNQISDDELGIITFYLASAIERQKKPLRTLLITDYSKSNQTILEEKIEFNISEISIEKMILYGEFPFIEVDDFDLILTTRPLDNNVNVPFFVIENVMNDDHLIQLKRAVMQLYKDKNLPK